jgi:hypothetical protein
MGVTITRTEMSAYGSEGGGAGDADTFQERTATELATGLSIFFL